MELLNDPLFQSLSQTWLTLMLIVALACFAIGEITRNYSQVDKLWSLLPVAYSWITFSASPSPRILIMSILISVWGLRLSYNFGRKGGYSMIPWKGEEDYRWKILKEHPALRGRLRFGLFNLLFISIYQNIVILLFSSPLLLAALFPEKPLGVTDLLAALFMTLFIVTESVADNQLFEFRSMKKGNKPASSRYAESMKAGFLKEGLWKYVRHPNFTSEQAIWISFYFFGATATGKWINPSIAGPVLLVLLFAGSSELTESISAGKYTGYAGYRKDVPRFIPFPGFNSRKNPVKKLSVD
jgi:steroid 5-alpha reductase family enzyme